MRVATVRFVELTRDEYLKALRLQDDVLKQAEMRMLDRGQSKITLPVHLLPQPKETTR